METENVNMNLICRTCKCVGPQMRSLFEGFENPHQSPRIDEMLMACASVQVMCGDGLPTLICQICVEQLKNAFVFKRQVEKVDMGLREYAKNLKVNEIKQELQNSEFMESLNTLDSILSEQQETTKSIPSNGELLPSGQPKFETDYIQFMDNNQMLLTCRECAKMFTTLEGLRCHKRVHSGGMYKCKQCDKEYTRLNHLQRHEQSHNRRKVHVCRICSKTLTRMEHLKRHLVTHLREKPFACKTCNRGFNRIEHLHNHAPRCKGDTVYPCDICNKAFNREDSLEVHKKMHDNQAPKLPTIENLDNIEDHYYQIDQDNSTVDFSDHSDVDDCFEPHVEVTETEDDKMKVAAEISNQVHDLEDKSIHSDGDNDDAMSLGGGDDSEADEADKDIDDNEPEDSSEEREHSQMPLGHEIPDEDKSEDVKIDPGKLQDNDDEFIKDVLADVDGDDDDDSDKDSADSDYTPKKPVVKVKRGRGRPRKNPDEPPKPKKMKMGKTPGKRGRKPGSKNKVKEPGEISLKCEKDEEYGEFPCPICNEMFHSILKLDKHARFKHEGEKIGEKKYECPLCHKFFTTEKYRDVHVAGHNGKMEYSCKVCEKTFLSKSHLTEHMKFHNEHSKKFLCSECGQRFIRNDYLVIHMRRHRGEKPFKCKYCGKGFPRTTDLTVHERYHTGEKTHLCTICGRGFGRAYNLTVHMRTHTGEKPYQCTYCDAAFAQGNDLKAHIRRHTGERFQCDLCSESFLMGYLLTQHKRTVHGLNVVSNIRRLQPIHKQENPEEPPPITIPLPKPVIPDNVMFNALHANALHANALHANALHANALHAQLAAAQLHLARE